MRLRTVALALALCAAWLAPAARCNAQATANATREIEALIAAIGASRCSFQRNGRWHDADAAQAHLRKKYAYLRKRDLADTAELFIERGASRSSVSGDAYRVRCGAAPISDAAPWFRRKLSEIRAGKGG